VVLRALPEGNLINTWLQRGGSMSSAETAVSTLLFHTCQFGTEAVKTAKLFACSYYRSEEPMLMTFEQ
jgi:hypothetical protein